MRHCDAITSGKPQGLRPKTQDVSPPDHPKAARTDHEILDVIRLRWSPRAFDAARDLDAGDLRRLFEAARWAPSSRNEQPWRFVVTSRTRSAAAFSALLASLTPLNQAWAAAAPVRVLAVVRLRHERDDLENAHAWDDAGQAVAYLSLQATAMGLSTRQMQGFSPEAAAEACQVPAEFAPAVVFAVGYAGEPSSLAIEYLRAAELVSFYLL